MNHAVLCVTWRARPSWCELTSFLDDISSQNAGSHLSRPSGESSKIVPTFTVNCLRQVLQRQMIPRVLLLIVQTSVPPQSARGQVTFPSGQRTSASALRQTSVSE